MISKCIVKHLGTLDILQNESGLIDIGTKLSKKSVGVNSATVKFLCQKHNSLLSPFDKEAEKFFSALNGFAQNKPIIQNQIIDKNGIKRVIIDGNKFEKWAAKTFLNLSAFIPSFDETGSGWGYFSGHKIAETVFEKGFFEKPHGLYVLPFGTNLHNDPNLTTREFRFRPLLQKTHFKPKDGPWTDSFLIPSVFYFSTFGLEFLFYVDIKSFSSTIESNAIDNLVKSEAKLKGLKYRPQAIGILDSDNPYLTINGSRTPQKIIEFKW